MATSDGPIAEGIKNAIKASKLTPYAIAKAVTARGKVKLTPAQIYKFKSGTAGMTLAILDEIAAVLGLVVQARQTIASHEPTIQDRPSAAKLGQTVYDLSTPEARRAARREERKRQREDPARVAFHARVHAMKDSLAERRAASAAKPNAFEDDGDEAEQPSPTPKRPLPRSTDDEDTSWDNYQPPSGEAKRTKSMGSVNAREITEKIRIISSQLANPGMQALAAKYGGPGRTGSGIEKAKFFRFVSQMLTNNTHAAAIMMRPDLVDRFEDIARLVPDPKNVGTIGDVVSPEDLWPASEDPEKFKDLLKRILASQGVVNAVVEPRKGPKTPGHC